MAAIREIIQLAESGGDLILKTFAKINQEKEKFKAPAEMKLSAGFPTRMKPSEEVGEEKFLKKFGNILNQFKKPGIVPPMEEKPKTDEDKNQLIKNTRKASGELNNLARSAASMDPTQFTSGLVDAVGNVTTKLASSIPVIGDYLGAVGNAATEITKMSSGMAANSLNLIKNAQNTAIDTMEKRGRMLFYGGQSLQNKGYALAEKSGIVESIAARYGKFAGTSLEKSVNRLFANNPDIQQAQAVAGGNYRALGTDKGFVLQQLADSLGNLPPSMAQQLQSQLLDTIQPEELNKDLASGYRQTRATFDTQDRGMQQTIAGMSKGSDKLNEELNKLSVNLASGGRNLIGSIQLLTKQINYALSFMQSGTGIKAK